MMFGKIVMTMNPVSRRLFFQPLLVSGKGRSPNRLLHRPRHTHTPYPPPSHRSNGRIPIITHAVRDSRWPMFMATKTPGKGGEEESDSIIALSPESSTTQNRSTSLETNPDSFPSHPSPRPSLSSSSNDDTYTWEELLQEKERLLGLLSSSSSLEGKEILSSSPPSSPASLPQPLTAPRGKRPRLHPQAWHHISIEHLLNLLTAFREYVVGAPQRSISQPSSSLPSYHYRRRRQQPHDPVAAQGSSLAAAIHADSLLQALERWVDMAERQDDDQLPTSRPGHADPIPRARSATELIPSAAMYQLVMQAYVLVAAASDQPEEASQAAQEAQAILERMLHRCRRARAQAQPSGPPSTLMISNWPPEPRVYHWTTLIQAWAKSRRPDAGQRAEEVHRLMAAWTRECAERPPTAVPAHPTTPLPAKHRSSSPASRGPVPYRGCQPDEFTVVALMHAWAESRHPDAPERAFRLLTEALSGRRTTASHNLDSEDHLCSHGEITPNVVLFNAAIKACVESGRGRQAALRAEEILNLLVQYQAQQTDARRGAELQPDTLTYSLVVDAWAKCEAMEGSGQAAARAEGILRHMLDLYRRGVDVKPNVVTFTSCLAAWARSQAPDSVDRANELWEWLMTLYRETGDLDFRPNTQAASVMISAWARRVDRKESYERMMYIFGVAKELFTPSTITYNTVLDGLGRRGMIQEAIELLSWMEDHMKPTVISYCTVLAALARVGQAERAEWLVDRMRDRGVPSNSTTMNTLIDAWSRSDDPNKASRAERIMCIMLTSYLEGDSTMKPDVVNFINCISAWSRCSSSDSFDRACRLWDLLVAIYRKTGDQDLLPNLNAVNSLISVWARHCDGKRSHDRMLAVLEVSKEFVTPDIITYNTILDGLGRRGMVKEAMELLSWMEFHMKPDLISYNCIVAALARRGQCADAERVFERMKKERALTPNRVNMNTLLNAWARSNDPGRASRAQHVLHSMLKRYREGDSGMKPNRITFTTMMKACQPTTASSREKRQRALEVAMETYRLFREGQFGDLDDQAYLTCIRAIQELVEDEQQRSKLLLSVFRDCQGDGLVSERVIQAMGNSSR